MRPLSLPFIYDKHAFTERKLPVRFVLITSFLAGMMQLVTFYNEGNYLLVFLDFVVLVVSVLVMLEAASVVSKLKKDQAASEGAP